MKSILYAFILVTAAASLLAAGGKPDFSGTWKLDPLRSRFSKDLPAPKELTLTIEHHEPKLHVHLKMDGRRGAEDVAFDLTTDGAESQQAGSGGTYTASVRWGDIDGTRLVLTIKEQSPSGTVTASRVMKIGANGKIMTTVLTEQDGKGTERADEFYQRAG